ncbi:hypothetical protein X474_07035 [Dethiosulfatarculus sandiegensis]|uniref:Uncharacterized protein n=1 Tax=Dethiosulfatarculus sandiegensis TaxID=1429043 RepID=A0A0D2JZC8_9BACT|nr:hypothetical protein X474_07035 [Dethiosulfatarculus sandiegensis]
MKVKIFFPMGNLDCRRRDIIFKERNHLLKEKKA